MSKEGKKVARKRFDEIMGVAKRHHLASLLKDNKEDDDFEVADLICDGGVGSCIYQIGSTVGYKAGYGRQ